MMCPHCKNNPRKAVIIIDGDYWCDECAPEVWALMQAAQKAACRDELPVGFKRGLTDALAALEVKP